MPDILVAVFVSGSLFIFFSVLLARSVARLSFVWFQKTWLEAHINTRIEAGQWTALRAFLDEEPEENLLARCAIMLCTFAQGSAPSWDQAAVMIGPEFEKIISPRNYWLHRSIAWIGSGIGLILSFELLDRSEAWVMAPLSFGVFWWVASLVGTIVVHVKLYRLLLDSDQFMQTFYTKLQDRSNLVGREMIFQDS